MITDKKLELVKVYLNNYYSEINLPKVKKYYLKLKYIWI